MKNQTFWTLLVIFFLANILGLVMLVINNNKKIQVPETSRPMPEKIETAPVVKVNWCVQKCESEGLVLQEARYDVNWNRLILCKCTLPK